MKNLFLLSLAVVALASCSKSELMSRPDNSDVEIKVKSMALSIDTRAPFEGTIAADNTLTALMLISKTTANYTTTYHQGEMTFEDNGVSNVGFLTPAYYPVDGSELFLCGLYPSDAASWGTLTAKATRTFTGNTDIMAAAEKKTTKAQAQAGTYPSMEFNHLLTKLVIKMQAEDAAAIAGWGKVTDIVLTQAGGSLPCTKVDVTLATGTAATGTDFATTTANFPFYVIADDKYSDDAFAGRTLVLTEDAVSTAYSLAAPITATGTADFKLKVTTQKDSETPIVSEVVLDLKKTDGTSAFTGDTQANAFVITLTFKATDIKGSASVTDWVDGGSTGADIQ